jgi:hypothetical protein
MKHPGVLLPAWLAAGLALAAPAVSAGAPGAPGVPRGAAAAGTAESAAQSAASRPARAAEIPFASLGQIRDFAPQKDGALLIEAVGGKTYRAEFLNRCIGLRFAEEISFVVDARGTFDRFSSVIVGHERCFVKSLSLVARSERTGEAASD